MGAGCLRDAGVVSLITSLNPALLQRSVTNSGRGIDWVELSLIEDIDAFFAVLPGEYTVRQRVS